MTQTDRQLQYQSVLAQTHDKFCSSSVQVRQRQHIWGYEYIFCFIYVLYKCDVTGVFCILFSVGYFRGFYKNLTCVGFSNFHFFSIFLCSIFNFYSFFSFVFSVSFICFDIRLSLFMGRMSVYILKVYLYGVKP